MKFYQSLLFFVFILSLVTSAQAACRVDSYGEVWCSKFPMGEIHVDRMNQLVCGKGECRLDRLGEFLCSKVEGGGAAEDAVGMVFCLGGCEPATPAYCVRGKPE